MKYFRLTLLVLFALFGALCVTLMSLPMTWEVYGHSDVGMRPNIKSITSVDKLGLANLVFFLLAVVFLILALAASKVKRIPFVPCLWILPLVVFPLGCTVSVFRNLGSWTTHGTVQDKAGNAFYFLDSSFLQGQMMSIGRLKQSTLFFDKYEIFVTTTGDSPRRFLHIVRPLGTADDYGQLYLTPDNWLVGLRYENRMFLAYDLDAKKPYGWHEVMDLSPFVLIGRNDRLNHKDCKQLLEVGIGDEVGQPRRNAVEAALNHENPAVVELAKQLLELTKLD